MPHWLVELDGEAVDLEEYPRWFPDGDVHACSEGEKVFLCGAAFDRLGSSIDVLAAADQALDELSGVILLLWPGFCRPILGPVYLVDESGNRARHVFGVIHTRVRAKDYVDGAVSGVAPTKPGPTEAQQLLAASRRATNAQAALMIWADPSRTWPRLYRILEELEAELRTTVSEAGLCSDSQRRWFTRSANSAEVAGKDARHAGGKFLPPSKPMSLPEAVAFVGKLIQETLHRVPEGAGGAD